MKLTTLFTFIAIAIIGTDLVSASNRRRKKHVRGVSSSSSSSSERNRDLQVGGFASLHANLPGTKTAADVAARLDDGKSKGGGKGNKTVTIGQCSTICGEDSDSTSERQPVCDAVTAESWKNDAGACCCVGGISYLKFVFDTEFYTTEPGITGTFSVSASETRSSAITTNADIYVATDDWYNDDTNVDDDAAADGRSDTAKGTEDNIWIVDCEEECLTDPLSLTECRFKSKTQMNVEDGTSICIVNFEDANSNVPLFTLKFPTNTMVYFMSNSGNSGAVFEANIHTSCSNPAVAPWAAVVKSEGNSYDDPINLDTTTPSGDIVLAFEGGISTSYFEAALANITTNEAGFQLDREECGCNCSPTESPVTDRTPEPSPEPTLAPQDIILSPQPSAPPSPDTFEPTPIFTFVPTSMSPETSCRPSPNPTPTPTVRTDPPTIAPTPTERTEEPTPVPTRAPQDIVLSPEPSSQPTESPSTESPTFPPTFGPTTDKPSTEPSTPPTTEPTDVPSTPPTTEPTDVPSTPPTTEPTDEPSTPPPTTEPSDVPTLSPHDPISCSPTPRPTLPPTPPDIIVSPEPSNSPSESPTTPAPQHNPSSCRPSADTAVGGGSTQSGIESSNTCGENGDASSICKFLFCFCVYIYISVCTVSTFVLCFQVDSMYNDNN
jgi:hypothetical protein